MGKFSLLILVVCIAIGGGIFSYARALWYPLYLKVAGHSTVAEVINEYGENAENNLKSHFNRAGVHYPPSSISLIGIKDQKILELWAHNNNTSTLITTYPIKAASGHLGPKLNEGDRQVPEGIYKILSFNPNSAYHLSMKLNYPNEFDLKYAKIEGREYPGTNIFIHGKAISIGCLAMGDPVIEELFTLVHKVKRQNVQVVITPTDPVKGKLIKPEGGSDWITELYTDISNKINEIRKT